MSFEGMPKPANENKGLLDAMTRTIISADAFLNQHRMPTTRDDQPHSVVDLRAEAYTRLDERIRDANAIKMQLIVAMHTPGRHEDPARLRAEAQEAQAKLNKAYETAIALTEKNVA